MTLGAPVDEARPTAAFAVYDAIGKGSVVAVTRRQAEFLACRGWRVIVVSDSDDCGWRVDRWVPTPALRGAGLAGLNYALEGAANHTPARLRRWFSMRGVLPQMLFGFACRQALAAACEPKPDVWVACQHASVIGLGWRRTPRCRAASRVCLVSHGDIYDHPWRSFSLSLGLLYRFAAWHAYRTADLVIAISSAIARRAVACGAKPAKVQIVLHGVEKPEPRESSAARAGGSAAALFVGRLAPEKGADVLLRAMSAVSDLPLTLVIAGDGPERESLERCASRLGLRDRVFFTGALDAAEIAVRYRACGFVVVPSVSEGLSLVALEAMSHGLPVIASRVGGLPDLVTDGENGLLVAPGQALPLAQAIRRMVQDPLLRTRMGRASRARASVLSWEAQLDTLERCLRRLARASLA